MLARAQIRTLKFNLYETEWDDLDTAMMVNRYQLRAKIKTPLVGDYLKHPDGSMHRFTHQWSDGMQTAKANHGSFYLESTGYADYSGSLDPMIPFDRIEYTPCTEDAEFWFFHHGRMGGGRGVSFKIPVRVWELKP